MLDHLNTAIAAIGALAVLAQLALDAHRAGNSARKNEDDQER
ncbi:hypothetical protein ACMZ5F_25235 [Streptomyces rhizosphaericola]